MLVSPARAVFLTITNNGTVQAGQFFVGHNLNSTNNLLTIGGGTLTVNGTLDVRRGQLVFNDHGNINANNLMLTNGGFFGATFIFNFMPAIWTSRWPRST